MALANLTATTVNLNTGRDSPKRDATDFMPFIDAWTPKEAASQGLSNAELELMSRLAKVNPQPV